MVFDNLKSDKPVDLDFSTAFKTDRKTEFFLNTYRRNSIPHRHDFFEIMYVLKGTIHHSVNFNKPITMNKGDYMLIDIDSIHEYCGENHEVINIAFYDSFIDKRMNGNSKIYDLLYSKKVGLKSTAATFPSCMVLHDNSGIIFDMINIIFKMRENTGKDSAAFIRHCIISMLIYISTSPDTDFLPGNISEATSHLLDYTKKNYSNQGILNDAAAELNYSVSYLSAKFKEDMKTSFRSYLQKYRVEMAKTLFNTTPLNVSQVSSDVGYKDVKFFSALFKKYTGITPSQYKKKVVTWL